MREKIGTSINGSLLAEARLMALRKKKKLNEIIEEALAKYLDQEKMKQAGSIVRATRNVIQVDPKLSPSLTFNEIADGQSIFIDANIFVYHFTGISKECSNFLLRCETGLLNAFTTVGVVGNHGFPARGYLTS